MGQHAQLDLAVVGGDELVPAFGDEGRADLAALLGADRNVLQVGIGRGEAARRGGREGVEFGGLGRERGSEEDRHQ